MTTQPPPTPLCVPHAEAWHDWLLRNERDSPGVWLLLAKRGTTSPTSLSYQDALEEALCGGWIDGQRRGHDDTTFMQRFTPRRARSIWSQRNVAIVARLDEAGRLRAGGIAEVELARADGRWDRAYAGPATAVAPPALTAALAATPGAEAAYAALSASARYSLLHPILTAPNEATLERRIARAVSALAAPGMV